jgi:hypothetical protein
MRMMLNGNANPNPSQPESPPFGPHSSCLRTILISSTIP